MTTTAHIYTKLGKEHVRNFAAYMIKDGHLIFFTDDVILKDVKRLISSEQPCTIFLDIREDNSLIVGCTFSECKLCKCNEIIYKEKIVNTIQRDEYHEIQ